MVSYGIYRTQKNGREQQNNTLFQYNQYKHCQYIICSQELQNYQKINGKVFKYSPSQS